MLGGICIILGLFTRFFAAAAAGADGFATNNADLLILIEHILLVWAFVGVAY